MMHECNPAPTWIIGDRVRVPCDDFLALQIIDGSKPTAAPPARACKALIAGRWHRVQRGYSFSFGIPKFFARPIVIIANAN